LTRAGSRDAHSAEHPSPGGPALAETVVARTFLGRWLRRGLLAGFGVGFTVPYFAILNDVQVEGDVEAGHTYDCHSRIAIQATS